jgi:hypothetical protein
MHAGPPPGEQPPGTERTLLYKVHVHPPNHIITSLSTESYSHLNLTMNMHKVKEVRVIH